MDLKELIKQLTRGILDENKTNTHKVKLTLDNVALKKFQTIPTFKNLLYSNQLSSLKTGDNNFTVNNAVYSTLQRMAGPGGYKIEKILDENEGGGIGNTTAAVPGYNSKLFLKKKKVKESNYTKASNYGAESGFTKKSPSSNPSLYLQQSEYTLENMNEAPEQKKGKRYIPDQFEFPEFLLKPITIGQEEPRVYFKIASKGDESVLMIDPLVGVALGAIQRGRTSFGSHHDLPALTRYMQEKVPESVRGLVKKYSTGADIQSNGFMALPLIMTKKLMSGSSTGNNIVKINDKGINVLKAIKANPDKAKGFEDELQFLIYLYKNKETTPKEYANAVGVSSMLVSRIANTLSTQGAIDMETVQNTGVEGDTWYIVNPIQFKKDKEGNVIKTPPRLTPGINTPMYEALMNIVKEELLNEVTYHKFKNEIKFRTKNEQLHRAIREVKRKLSEIDRIVEYTSLMKQELSENEAGSTYWKATQNNVTTIAEMVNQLNNKIKNLQQ